MTVVQMNHGRWVASCQCGGAERLWPDGRIQVDRYGMPYGVTRSGVLVCGSCRSESMVQWPNDETVAAVERAVAARPDPTTRNWWPAEPVELLELENIANGVADPAGLHGAVDRIMED